MEGGRRKSKFVADSMKRTGYLVSLARQFDAAFNCRKELGSICCIYEGFPYLAKVNLVEDDLVGVGDAPESRHEAEDGEDRDCDPVVPFGALLSRLVRLDLLYDICSLLARDFGGWRRRTGLVLGHALTHAIRRRHGG